MLSRGQRSLGIDYRGLRVALAMGEQEVEHGCRGCGGLLGGVRDTLEGRLGFLFDWVYCRYADRGCITVLWEQQVY